MPRYGRESTANLDGEPDTGLAPDSGQEPAVPHCDHLQHGRGARRRWAQILAVDAPSPRYGPRRLDFLSLGLEILRRP